MPTIEQPDRLPHRLCELNVKIVTAPSAWQLSGAVGTARFGWSLTMRSGSYHMNSTVSAMSTVLMSVRIAVMTIAHRTVFSLSCMCCS